MEKPPLVFQTERMHFRIGYEDVGRPGGTEQEKVSLPEV